MKRTTMHYHHQNLSRGKSPIWHHGRAWLGQLQWEWCVFHRPRFSLSIGRRHLTLCLLVCSLYVVWKDDGEFERRGFELAIHDGKIWIEHPWIRQGEWRRNDPWWKKQIVISVVDLLLGKHRFSSTETELPDVFVPMPEGSYRAKAKLVQRRWMRRFGWFRKMRDDYELSVDGGIPFAGKGENSWDCGDDGLWGCGGTSVENAIAQGVESVLTDRRKRGLDSLGTGKIPAIVLNDRSAVAEEST